MKLLVEEAAIWWVATNFNVSSRQGSRLLGLSPSTIPCLSLPILHTLQAMETVCRFPFPKHLVEECVDLS